MVASQTDYTNIFPYVFAPLECKEFDEIKVSTRTCMAQLRININLQKFYDHATITTFNQPKTKSKKNKITHIDKPGAILSMLYNGKFKGISTRENPKPFLNQLTFIMSLDGTNANFKLFNNGAIQATGLKTKQHIFDLIHYLVEEGKRIEKEHELKIFETGPTMDDIEEVMINVDFKLDFKIDRKAFNTHIAGLNGFKPTFDSDLTSSGVSLKIPRENGKGEDTFICFHTGSVLLSGNNLEHMKKVYYMFMESIDSIKHDIVTTPAKIKFVRRKINVKFE